MASRIKSIGSRVVSTATSNFRYEDADNAREGTRPQTDSLEADALFKPSASALVSNPVMSMELSNSVNRIEEVAVTHPKKNLQDPEMQKPYDAQAIASSLPTKAYNKLVLKPSNAVKRKTWGSPRRRMCTMFCFTVLLIIVTFLVCLLLFCFLLNLHLTRDTKGGPPD
jgi:hypothetical protein